MRILNNLELTFRKRMRQILLTDPKEVRRRLIEIQPRKQMKIELQWSLVLNP